MLSSISIRKLFRLFELDKLLVSREIIEEKKLIKLAGQLQEGKEYLENIEEEYRSSSRPYPERCWKVQGKDFIIDIYDEGNGWYSILKVRENEGEGK